MTREAIKLTVEELDRHAHALFKQYRDVTPVIERDDGTYLVIRPSAVELLTADPRTRQPETELASLRGLTTGAIFEFFKNTMLFSNGTDHRRRRASMMKPFAYKLISDLRPRVRAVANSLIDGFEADGEVDLLERYGSPLPAQIISEILGLPKADVPRFTQWVYSMSRGISSLYRPEMHDEVSRDAEELKAYVVQLLESRRSAPQGDFLSTYVEGLGEDNALSAAEAINQVISIIIGGSDTTRLALVIQAALLLEHEEQWRAVCEDPALIPGAVSEALRYEPSVASFPRVLLDDIEVDGLVLKRFKLAFLSTMAVMRDPAVYANPETFDIRRTDHPRKHIVFGNGVHRCIGEVLARIELEEGLAALAERLPGMRRVGPTLNVRGHVALRRAEGLRVKW